MKKLLLTALLTTIAISAYPIIVNTGAHNTIVNYNPAGNFAQIWPYFLFTFVISLIGSFSLYGIFMGPAALIGIYILTKDKKKRTYAWIGFILGTVLGVILKILYIG